MTYLMLVIVNFSSVFYANRHSIIILQPLCAILCATIVYSAIHTHMNRPNSSLDWVLSHWAHFTVLRFIFVCVLLCVHHMHVYCVVL